MDGRDFVDSLCEEIADLGFDAPSVEVLLDMAFSGQYSTVAQVLTDMVTAGQTSAAAGIVKQIIGPKTGLADNFTPAMILSQMIQSRQTDAAADVCKDLLVPEDDGGTPNGDTPHKPQQRHSAAFDPYLLGNLLGCMMDIGHADWAGTIVAQMLPSSSQPDTDDAEILPSLLQWMVATGKEGWAAGLALRVMTLGGESSVSYYDVGTSVARLADEADEGAAAALCTSIRKQAQAKALAWFDMDRLWLSIASSSTRGQGAVRALKALVPDAAPASPAPAPVSAAAATPKPTRSPMSFNPSAAVFTPAGASKPTSKPASPAGCPPEEAAAAESAVQAAAAAAPPS